MTINYLIYALVVICALIAIALYATRPKKKRLICKKDGRVLKYSGVGDTWYCPKCRYIYKINE